MVSARLGPSLQDRCGDGGKNRLFSGNICNMEGIVVFQIQAQPVAECRDGVMLPSNCSGISLRVIATKIDLKICQMYSRHRDNPYPSMAGPGYGLLRVMGYQERDQNGSLFPQYTT